MLLTSAATAAAKRARPLIQRIGIRSLASSSHVTTQTIIYKHNGSKYKSSSTNTFTNLLLGLAGAGTGIGAGIVSLEAPTKNKSPSTDDTAFETSLAKEEEVNYPPPRPDLPTIPLEEVAEHCDEDSLWFTFRGAVYDLTFFINGHPGGTPRLLMAGE